MKKLVIDIGMYQSKIAYVKSDKLVDLFVEDKKNKSIEGNIYMGIVQKVVKGLDAAFIDIGCEKSAYLSIKDQNIKQGDYLLVQVKKEPIEDKGAKVSTNISIPGRYLVVTNDTTDVKVSSKIKNQEESLRIKEIIEGIKPENVGVIVRTQGQGMDAQKFKDDLNEVMSIFIQIQREKNLGLKSKLVYKREDFVIRILKNIVDDSFEKIIVNDEQSFNQIKEYLNKINKNLVNKLVYFDEGIDIFDFYKIKQSFDELLEDTVVLENGAYIIIERTKALTVIDVNSGGYIGNLRLDKTAYDVNVSAAKEIASQIRLRDIGGIIVVDFIDMKDENRKQNLLRRFQSYLSKDKDKAKVLGMTNLGLVEVVRRKKSMCIDEYFMQMNSLKFGVGKVHSLTYMLDKIEKEIIRIKSHTNKKSVAIGVSLMRKEEFYKNNKYINAISDKYGIEITINGENEMSVNDIKVYL